MGKIVREMQERINRHQYQPADLRESVRLLKLMEDGLERAVAHLQVARAKGKYATVSGMALAYRDGMERAEAELFHLIEELTGDPQPPSLEERTRHPTP